MGILDDAIREHLELKRSHGASDEEIRLKEAEVFGPVRSEAAVAAPEEHTQLLTPDELAELHDDAAPAAEAGPVLHAEPTAPELDPLEPAAEDPYVVHPGDDLMADPDAAAAAGAGSFEPAATDPGPPPQAPQHHPDEQHPALIDHEHIGGEEHAPEPVFGHAAAEERPQAPDAPLQPAPEDPYVGDPPFENPAIDEPPPRQSPDPADAEDVLEETPEFLQDAPEHDRLWFEQRPPRDFDFGE